MLSLNVPYYKWLIGLYLGVYELHYLPILKLGLLIIVFLKAEKEKTKNT
jgi:hypothetical protein